MFHSIDFTKLDREQRRKERIVQLKQKAKEYKVDGTPYKVIYYINNISTIKYVVKKMVRSLTEEKLEEARKEAEKEEDDRFLCAIGENKPIKADIGLNTKEFGIPVNWLIGATKGSYYLASIVANQDDKELVICRVDWNKEYHLFYIYFRLCFLDLIKKLVDSW